MRHHGALAVGPGLAVLLLAAAPASGQVRVDIGVVVPPVAARVVVGDRSHYPAPYYGSAGYYETRPSHERNGRSWKREHPRERARHGREYVPEARGQYWRDRREPERGYWMDRREAKRGHRR